MMVKKKNVTKRAKVKAKKTVKRKAVTKKKKTIKKEKMLKNLGERMKQGELARSNIKEGVRVIPQIEEVLKLTKWQIKSVQNMPKELEITDEMLNITKYENKSFVKTYGSLFSKEVKIDIEYSPIVSGTSSAVTFYHQASHNKNYREAKMSWAEENIGEYLILSNELKRQNITEKLIRKLNTDIADEFHSALQDFAKLRADIVKIPDLALRFRTIMEKVKGELKVKLLLPKIQVKSNKIFEELANRFTGGIGKPDYNLFCIEIKSFKKIHSTLTSIGKSNIVYNSTDFEILFATYIDNLYAILSILANHRPDVFK